MNGKHFKYLFLTVSALLCQYAPSGSAAQTTTDPVLLVAGDVAQCNVRGPQLTADLINRTAGTVLAPGDLAYQNGSIKDFTQCYEPSWGKFKERTWPAPGNHEYNTRGAAGYFEYFGSRAGEPGKGYYSITIGKWHVVALNSNIDTAPDSEQVQWLRKDLAAHPATCTLAFWHHPRFSSGLHGNHRSMTALWETLYQHGASIVIAGHDHHYERFIPLNGKGEPDDARGIRSFVVGTGGARLYNFGMRNSNSAAWNGTTWGVLKLTLHADSYDWEFLPVEDGVFHDAGTGQCVNKE